MIALGSIVEELPSRAVEHVQSLGGVAHGVAVHHVQQHPYAHLVGGIDQILQIVGLAEPAGGGIEVGNLIAEGAVIGMLHDGHQLDGVVACPLHPGQHQIGKFAVRADALGLLRHAHMSLVDEEFILAAEIRVGPGIALPVVHNFGHPGDGFLVLHHPPGVEGNVFRAGHVGVHHGLDPAAFPKRVVALQIQLPVAVFQLLQGMAGLVPVVEIAGQVELMGAGRPFAVVPAALHVMKAEIAVGIGKIIQPPVVNQLFLRGLIELHAQLDIAGKGLELGIEFQNLVHARPPLQVKTM